MLRVLATWNPAILPVPDQEGGYEMAKCLGYVPGEDAQDSYATRFDERKDLPPGWSRDHGWIGEDKEGIWIKRHPEVELASHPELVGLVRRWRLTSDRELIWSDIDRLSAFEALSWVVMLGAQAREVKRQSDDRTGKTGTGKVSG